MTLSVHVGQGVRGRAQRYPYGVRLLLIGRHDRRYWHARLGDFGLRLFVAIRALPTVRMTGSRRGDRGGWVSASLSIEIGEGSEAEDIDVDTSALQLRRELLELDVDAVERAPGAAETGAKGGSELTDVLIVTLSNSTALVAMLGVLKTWLKRKQGRKIRVTIGKNSLELDQPSSADEARLISAWIDWHGPK